MLIKVNPDQEYPNVSWPKDLKAAGFVGELEVLTDGLTMVIIKPALSLEKARESLRLLSKQLALRE